MRERRTADGRPADHDPATWASVLRRVRRVPASDVRRRRDLARRGRPGRAPGRLSGAPRRPRRRRRPVGPGRGGGPGRDRRRATSARRPGATRRGPRRRPRRVAVRGNALDHGDLHGNNVLPGPDGGFRVFDWGDAVVAHPFATLTTTLGSIAYHAGLDAYGPDVAPARDAYLDAWADLAPRDALDAERRRWRWTSATSARPRPGSAPSPGSAPTRWAASTADDRRVAGRTLVGRAGRSLLDDEVRGHVLGDGRVARLEPGHRVGEDRGHREVAEPLAVGRDDVPRGRLGRGPGAARRRRPPGSRPSASRSARSPIENFQRLVGSS